MDFRDDLYEIAKQLLDRCGVDTSSAKISRDFIEMYMNIRLKLIPKQKYQVSRSNYLTSKNFSQEIRDGIDFVQKKLEQGVDITSHMSKRILDGTFPDLLFSDWGIYHLHLGLSMKGNFIERTGEVLFLSIQGSRAYFIDVRDHGKNGEKHVFAQFDLLQILANEFPEVIKPFELKAITGLSHNVTDPEEISIYRNGGVSLAHEINGKVYAPMGGGITTASTSVRVVEETDRLLSWADDLEKNINEKRDTIDSILSRDVNYEADNADFHLCTDYNELLLVDKHSGIVCAAFNYRIAQFN